MTPLKQILPGGKKLFLANMVRNTGLNHALSALPLWSGLLVANYHRIGDPQGCPFDQNLFSATPEALELQIRLYRRHADIIGVNDIPEALSDRRGKYVLITFDDGYRDNYELAYPVLKQAGVPAVFFIASGLIDRPRVAWWDEIAWMIQHSDRNEIEPNPFFPEGLSLKLEDRSFSKSRAVKTYWSLKDEQTEDYLNLLASQTGAGRAPLELAESLWMTWEMIREMQQAGFDFGGHTVDHPILAQISVDRQRAEIRENRERLIQELGVAPSAFAYPVGQSHMFTEQTMQILKEAG
ncbi:MAG: polysaccharide deacetylase family protein, partial [Planctomycetaceae bacterium]|nr:polysaccharide deacetylase family protein [Planctomycetaceae bacterium]